MSLPFQYERRSLSQHVTLWRFWGRPTLEEWRAVLHSAEVWLNELESRGQRQCVIVDGSEVSRFDAQFRRETGEWRAQHMPLIANALERAAYVAPNAFVRGLITAVFWFAQPVIPVSVRTSGEEARRWIEETRR